MNDVLQTIRYAFRAIQKSCKPTNPLTSATALSHTMNSLCLINGIVEKNNNYYSESNGVFIGPNTIITALHCVEGKTDLTFTNTRGETSKIKQGRQYIKNERLDIAIVPLDDDIGHHYSKVAPTNVCSINNQKNWLATNFNKTPLSHNVILDFYDALSSTNGMAKMFSNAAVGQGFSGSPIINQDGHIISIVSYITNNNETYYDKNSNKVGRIRNTCSTPFYGPKPEEFAEFYHASCNTLVNH